MIGLVTMPMVEKAPSIWVSTTFPPALTASIVSLVVFFLNRLGRYRLSVWLYMTMFILCPWWAIIRTNDIMFFPIGILMVGGIMMAGVLSVRGWSLMFGFLLCIGCVISIPLFTDTPFLEIAPILAVVINLNTIALILSYFRNKLERERINERREYENLLKDKAKELKRSNEDLQQFAYISSHDIKAPATNISSLIDMMDNEKEDESKRKELFSLLKQASTNMMNTILTLNEVFTVQNNLLKAPKEKVELESLVNETFESITSQIKDSEAKINTNFEAARHVTFPKIHLLCIFQNLLTNSIKFKQDEQRPKISIKSERVLDSERVKIEFSDNGKGIDLDKYENKVFKLFQRFHLDVEGNGMGLYIIKLILDRYGGEIEIKSSPGNGTTFIILI